MLHELLTANREELIRRCRTKVASRLAPGTGDVSAEHGVTLFLQQLIDTLQHEQLARFRHIADPMPTPSNSAIGRAAALHGAEMLSKGFSVDQVVREYGDVCQAVTEMAVEQQALIGANEFRTLNRCLDDAIADAVAAYGNARERSHDHDAQALHLRLGAFADEQHRLIDVAIQAYAAIKTGTIGVTGATGALLVHTLLQLHSLAGRTFAELTPPTASAHK